MSALLNKRLARSLWRTKLRLLAVVLMVFVGVFAGITFGGYAHNLDGMYANHASRRGNRVKPGRLVD